MAAPSVGTTNSTAFGTAATSFAVNLPASIAAKDLLVMFFVIQAVNPSITATGWVPLDKYSDAGAASYMSTLYRVADGTEGSTVTVSSTTSGKACAVVYRVTGWGDACVLVPSTVATATSVSPDPASVTTGVTADTLWIAAEFCNAPNNATAYPTNYSLGQVTTNSGGSGGSGTKCGVGVAARQITASTTEDPSAFTIGSAAWGAVTLAIQVPTSPATINVQTNIQSNTSFFINTSAVTAIDAEAWGAGGRGGAAVTLASGGGGGGGGYGKRTGIAVAVNGQSQWIAVGAGGSGNNTFFDPRAVTGATGGFGAAGGAGSGSTPGSGGGGGSATGSTTFSGGNGAAVAAADAHGGGGGGGGGSSAVGGNASTSTGGAGGTGNPGGSGGSGVAGSNGGGGSFAGGGGAGGGLASGVGGNGGDGQLILTWTVAGAAKSLLPDSRRVVRNSLLRR